MAYQIGGTVTVVEYDGDEHYRHSIKIKLTERKTRSLVLRGIGWYGSHTGCNWMTSP